MFGGRISVTPTITLVITGPWRSRDRNTRIIAPRFIATTVTMPSPRGLTLKSHPKIYCFSIGVCIIFSDRKNPLKGIKMAHIEDPQHGWGTETILLLEDDSSARKVTKLMLEKLGYCVIEAVDGEDALKKFHANKDRIQLVILDVIMPHGSSKPVYDKMLVIRSDIKAIFISGYTEDILKKTGMIEEGLHFLAKPFLPAELASKVREVLAT